MPKTAVNVSNFESYQPISNASTTPSARVNIGVTSQDTQILLPLTASTGSSASLGLGQTDTTSASVTIPQHRPPLIPNILLDLPDTSDIYALDTNMKAMDRLYNATFCEYIRSEEHVMSLSRQLGPIIKDYNLKLVASSLRWMMRGWRLESIAKLLKLLTRDWLPDVSGMLVNLITLGWQVLEQPMAVASTRTSRVHFNDTLIQVLTKVAQNGSHAFVLSKASFNGLLKLVAIMVAGESPDTAAMFVQCLTQTENWTTVAVTELVSFLDAVLEWDEDYFRAFTQSYVELVTEDANRQRQAREDASLMVSRTGKLSFDHLAAMYKTNLALANYRLALADFKIAMAARSLQAGESALSSPLSPVSEMHAASLTDKSDDEPSPPLAPMLLAAVQPQFEIRIRDFHSNSTSASTSVTSLERRQLVTPLFNMPPSDSMDSSGQTTPHSESMRSSFSEAMSANAMDFEFTDNQLPVSVNQHIPALIPMPALAIMSLLARRRSSGSSNRSGSSNEHQGSRGSVSSSNDPLPEFWQNGFSRNA
jgi:hypothetical protein